MDLVKNFKASVKAVEAQQAAANAKLKILQQQAADRIRQGRVQKHADVHLKVSHRSKQVDKTEQLVAARDTCSKQVRIAVLDEVKKALQRPYSKGMIDRDAYKAIAHKATNKVVQAVSKVRRSNKCTGTCLSRGTKPPQAKTADADC
jgi:hypothetical protein